MNILMLKTKVGAVNGIHIKTFLENKVYNIPADLDNSLAECFLNCHHAKIVSEKEAAFDPVEKIAAVDPVENVKAKKPKKDKK